MVFDLGQVLVAWDPLPAIAAGVGEERARAFLAADDFRFHEWNLTLDRGVPVAEAEEQAIADHPGYADEIRSFEARHLATQPWLANTI